MECDGSDRTAINGWIAAVEGRRERHDIDAGVKQRVDERVGVCVVCHM
jgi:hypothetical protein